MSCSVAVSGFSSCASFDPSLAFERFFPTPFGAIAHSQSTLGSLPFSTRAGKSFKLLGVFCSIPPLPSHIEIHTASVRVGSHLSGALELYRLLPARACPMVHIRETLTVDGAFQLPSCS
jgi:hypothetical protein